MTLDEAQEAFAVLGTMLTALQGSLSSGAGSDGAAFRYAIGDLRATGLALIQAGSLGLPLLECFMLALPAGATYASMDQVRAAMLAEAPSGAAAIAVADVGIRFALGRQARILAETTFASSGEVFAALSTVNDAFEPAEDHAADARDPTCYQALIALHATVVRDLTTRAVALPKLVTYRLPAGLTSHALANRLYGEAGRADELRAENGAIHPAFMPPSGTCLSE